MTYYLFGYWHDKRWTKFVGASVKIWDLAINLSKLGHQVILFLPKYNFNHTDLPFKVVQIPLINAPLIRFFSFNLLLIIFLIYYYFRKRPEIIYVRRMNSIVPALFAKIAKAVLFYEVNDDPYDKKNQEGACSIFRLRFFITRWQDEINLRLCDKAFIITQALLEKVLKNLSSLDQKKFEIAPSGANTSLFLPLEKNRCRLELNLAVDSKIIGFAGTLLEHQGIDTLITAAPGILKEVPSTKFLIIGEGPMKRRWVDAINECGLNHQFIFPGQVPYEEIPIWIGATDICLAPFLNSAGLRSPVKIFDYMACGRAVVASKIKGTTDLFENSEAISLVEAENPQYLARTIVELLKNGNKTMKMGAKGRQFIMNSYDRNNTAIKVSLAAQSLFSSKV